MADFSFDIVSEIDLQEMDNAVNQAQKEIVTRYDFRGTAASLEFSRKEKTLTITGDSETQLEVVRKLIVEKMIKRGVDHRHLDPQKFEHATQGSLRQLIKLKEGVEKEIAKKIQQQIKEMRLKVTASIQGMNLRVSGAKKDDLQAVMAALRKSPPEVPVKFENFR